MAVHHSELTPVELEFFADESKKVCLLHVMKGDRMMAEKVIQVYGHVLDVKLSLIKRYICTTIRTFACTT